MQHKSLFAALLCGALCLTACLKNEESPSVTQVRNAKAQELLSIATLNKANAEATLLLAKAEVKIKEAQAAYLDADAKYRAAEAEIRKAEAQKVLAEADLLKVQADLAKADLKLKEQELKQKEEELKALVAEYEARIAAANAEKLFWEAQMQLLEKELEAALTEAEAALWDAKLSLFESEKAYNDAIAEAEAAATEANKQAVEDLRALVADLNARYHAAALELLDLQFEIAETNKRIAGLEAGILDATDVKYAQIEKNNKEIARLTILRDAFKGVEGKTTEELLDESANVAAALIAQLRVVSDAADAYDAAEDAYLLSIPNQYGVETDDPTYAVTYTYTQDFYVRDADQKVLATLPVADPITGQVDDSYWHIDDNGNHHAAYIVEELDPETGLNNVIFREEIWTLGQAEFFGYTYSYMDELIDIQDTVLYTYCDGTYEWGVKYNGLVRYPELGEGISYDARTPYFTYDDEEYIPLDINREGYEKYVFFINQTAASERDSNIEDIDWDIAYNESSIESIQAFIDRYAKVYDKAEELLNNAIADVNAAYSDLQAKYDAYDEALQDYITNYVIDNAVERNDAWWDYQAAQEAYTLALEALELYNNEFVAENGEVEDLIAEIATQQGIIDAETKYFDDSEDYLWDQRLLEYYEGQLNKAQYNLTEATQPYLDAKKALEDQQALVAEKYTAAMQADVDYYAAWADWQALNGGELPKPQAVIDAEAAQSAAWGAYYTEQAKIAGLQSDFSTKEATYNTWVEQCETAKANYDAKAAAIAQHQTNIDEAQAKIDEINGIITTYNTDVLALNTAIDDAWAAVEEKIAAWDAVAGTPEWTAVMDKYITFQAAYSEFDDYSTNPVIQVFIKYGIITDPTDIEWSYKPYDEYDFWYYWYNYWEFYADCFIDEDEVVSFEDTPMLSPMQVYFLTEYYKEEIADLQAENEELEASKEIVLAAYEAQVEDNNKYLTELDEILVNEDVYFEGVAKCNDNYAALIEAEKVYFDETIKLYEIQGNLEALRAAYEESASLEELIAGVEEAIAELEADNEDWADIDDATVAVNKLKEVLKLTQSKAEVDEVLVESLKAELDEAVAALKATIGE